MTISPSNIYQQVEVATANNLRLVVMLYDGAIRFLSQAKVEITNRNLVGKAVSIDRALAIVSELQSTLEIEEGGEIAHSLNRIYNYMNERILDGSAKLDCQPLDEVIKLLRILNSAWSEIARKSELQAPKAVNQASPPLLNGSGQPTVPNRPLEIVG
jgi:flagellar secretion chaperone FliS